MQPSVLVAVADGSEEMELVIGADILRRAGANVVVASCNDDSLTITASRGVRIVADAPLSQIADEAFDAMVLPGGMPGAAHLRDCPVLIDMLRKQAAAGRWIAAICAAPAVVLQSHDLIAGRAATCHPTFQDRLDPATRRCEDRVVVDGHLLTSQGPGTTFEFALTLVELLFGKRKRAEIEAPLVLPYRHDGATKLC